MLVNELCGFLDQRFPRSLQESYDNTGDQVVFPDEIIKGIILALDLNPHVLTQAIGMGCNCILTHHPIFFRAKKSIIETDPFDKMVCMLIEKKITVFSLHTNLDRVYYSVPAQVIGLPVTSSLIKGDNETGMGTLSEMTEPLPLIEIVEKVCSSLQLESVSYSGNDNKPVQRIAVLNGSGGHFIEKSLPSLPVDCIITGDVGYHAWHLAGIYDTAVIDAGHFGTEKPLLTFLFSEIQDFLTKCDTKHDVQLKIAGETNPSRIYNRKR